MHSNPNGSEPAVANTAICTLFEGDYHLGLGAFVNSLANAGFKGRVWAGYRGALPPWLNQLRPANDTGDVRMVNDSITLAFLPLGTKLHLANYKPRFMLDTLNRSPGIDYLWYFDPDVFLRYKWLYFAHWQQHGIALCEEIVNYRLSETDPLRWRWRMIGTEMGLGNCRGLGMYFNSGMIGMPAAYADLLSTWAKILEHSAALGCDLTSFMPGSREGPFHSVDQDALNMALMYSDHPLSTMGPEGMGFIPGGAVMHHAVGHKPWRGSFLMRALAGLAPSEAAKFFFSHASSPIRIYSKPRLIAKQLGCRAAAFLGRFYRRR